MEKLFFIIGSILAGIGVAAGAFGAHGLKQMATPELLDTWEKAVRYQIYHAVAMFIAAGGMLQWPSQAKIFSAGGWLFTAGIILFSGSLYLLVLSGNRWLGAITPFGGVSFVAGWFCLVLAAWRG
jgi:uncharacterized membrane protein YgdD (TMEM256/DUF423 family)